MRVVAENDGQAECGGGKASEDRGGAVVVVGVKLDSRSRELLTWALVKVARSGDRVIALHILNPNADKSMSLVKAFDSVLAAYEGICNLKQVDLKFKVCRGSSVRKILSLEAKSCNATSVVVGISKVPHIIRSRMSVAKYCAKYLQKNVSIICVENGKILFQRGSSTSSGPASDILDASESSIEKRRTLSKSSLCLPPEGVLSLISSEGDSALKSSEPIKTKLFGYKSRWQLLFRGLLHGGRVSHSSSTKKSSLMQWLLKSHIQQSIAIRCPGKKQISASKGDHRSKLDDKKGSNVQYSADANPVAYSNKIFSEELKEFGKKYSRTCQLFSYQELLLATNNFSLENMIGKGGSSWVYKGLQPGHKEIAVKILKPSMDVLDHFVSEIKLITSLHHKNIISLVGFCFDGDRLLLVYNLLSRGSLEENLYDTQKCGNLLGWHERYKVALGIAKALEYLHDLAEPIIHRDIKSSNILLADDFEPKLSDFGLATWASSCAHQMDTSNVAGTFGYLAPEYFMHEKLNAKIDVYAFGVVLLELLSGRKPIDNGHPKGQESLVMWAKEILKEGKVSELRDPKLNDAYGKDQFERMALAATLCIRRAPQSRPAISTVLKLLQGDPKIVEWARQETCTSKDMHATIDGNIQSFINLALLTLEDDTTTSTSSSTEQNILVEDYLRSRRSRSSSFD